MATKKRATEARPLAEPDILAPPAGETAAAERVLHVNGKPVPEEFAHAIPYAMTDEGIAERNANRDEPSGVSVVRDAWDNALARGADLDTPHEVWEAENPLQHAIDRATGGKDDGYSYKLLSERICDRKGMRRFEPAMDAKTGKPIRVANMFLGRMPVELKEKRNEHYRRIGDEMLRRVEEAYRTDQEKAIRSSGSRDVSVLHSGDQLRDHREPERGASIGVRATRGEQ